VPSLNRASYLVADDREAGRYRLLLEAQTDRPEAAGASVVLHDISSTGLLFEADPGIGVDAQIMFDVAGVGALATRTVWTNGSFYGAEFITPLSHDQLKAVLLESKVVWPEFAPPPFYDIEQLRSRRGRTDPVIEEVWAEPIQGEGLEEDGPKLPVARRIQIVLGLSLLLWAAIIGALWWAFG